MGIGSKLSLIADIIRVIDNGKITVPLITENLTKQPLTLGSDVIALVPLAKKFGFIEGDDNNLRSTKQGRDFLRYIESTTEEISRIASPTETDYPTVDKAIKEIAEKYEKRDTDVYGDIQKIRRAVLKAINLSPEMAEDYELLLTASMPPNFGEKIPPDLLGTTILHDEAIKRVIQNTTYELIISTYSLDVNVFKMLVANQNTKHLRYRLIIADDRFKIANRDAYNLNPLKNFLDSHFISGEIRYVSKEGYRSHAKMWLSEKAVHITSANISSGSQTDNFELGIYSTRAYLIESSRKLIEKVWNLGETL